MWSTRHYRPCIVPWREMVLNNNIVELYYWMVQWHYLIIISINSLMARKSESDVRRLRHSTNDVKWPPAWGIMHFFTMRYISCQRCLVCVSTVGFWFVGILKFWYESLYVCEIVLSCCSLHCKFISSVLHLHPPLLLSSDLGGIIAHGWFRIFAVYIPWPVSLVLCGRFVSCCCLFFSAQRSSFSICCEARLVLLNSLCFCLSVKVLLSPSNLNESLAG